MTLRRDIKKLLVLYIYLSSATTSSTKKVKRVVNGEDLDKNSGYSVTNYFVWISQNNFCEPFVSFSNLINWIIGTNDDFYSLGYYECDIDTGKTRCGGALITPKIVQTACHCVGEMIETDNKQVYRFIAKDAFVDMALIFRGTSVADFRRGYLSRMFLVHQKCSFGYHTPMWDYGMIILKTAMAPDSYFAKNPLNFAPAYSKKGLKKLYNRVISKGITCLLVGFGYIKDDAEVLPSVLQHGWIVAQNDMKCFGIMNLKAPDFDYKSNATGSCFLPLPQEGSSHLRQGDSGSPVTCDNEYFGVVSAFIPNLYISITPHHPTVDVYLNVIAPIALTPFVNSIEDRPKLVKRMEEIVAEDDARARAMKPHQPTH